MAAHSLSIFPEKNQHPYLVWQSPSFTSEPFHSPMDWNFSLSLSVNIKTISGLPNFSAMTKGVLRSFALSVPKRDTQVRSFPDLNVSSVAGAFAVTLPIRFKDFDLHTFLFCISLSQGIHSFGSTTEDDKRSQIIGQVVQNAFEILVVIQSSASYDGDFYAVLPHIHPFSGL